MSDRDLTPRQVAERLGVTPRTVQRWIASGSLAASRVGGRVRVSSASLEAMAPRASGPPQAPIRRLLVANRGEIASRVARTARAMGIDPIGLRAPGDIEPRGMAEVHPIASFLDGAELLRIASAVGADGVHPGYGFLAENAEFASGVARAGLVWVGPPPEAIAAMGDKAAARRHVAELGLPVVPGYDGDAQDDETLVAEATRIGFPCLVKPSAGGGGKGMRVVRESAELAEALGAARREAARAFGDDRLILEKYLERPRHVEVQVLFDAHGNGVHLGERDCSAQRRNQKIIEEAPGPAVTPELRERMGEAAVRIGSSVGYVGAGTVEMLLTDAGDFYFLEMNTRLQVEHPVTEAVTGRDLVRDQLLVAAGEPLSTLGLTASPVLEGHAVEARIYAEDPESGFLPAVGKLLRVTWPSDVRIDTGVAEGDVVGDRYDPMLAKVIAHGRDRAEALDRLRAALERTTILGVRTNVRFLRWLLDQEPMRAGEMRTDTIERELPPPAATPTDPHWHAAALALVPPDLDPWGAGWRLNGAGSVRVRSGDEVRRVPLAGPVEGGALVAVDGPVAHVDVEGQSTAFDLAPAPSVDDALRRAAGEGGPGASVLTAPMPGRVVAVRASAGTVVEAAAPVVVVEAMKMEHAVVAPVRARITRVNVAVGEQVQRGDPLAEVEPYDATDG